MISSTVRAFLSSLFFIAGTASYAQTLPVGTPLLEESARLQQLRGELNEDISFLIRPLYSTGAPVSDSLALTADSSGLSVNQKVLYTKSRVAISLLPLTLKQQYNSHHPFGWNDGAMIPARGYQSLLSAGVYTKVGPLSIQLQPELVFAQNSAFTTFPTSLDDNIWKSYYKVLNRIDAPERFAEGTYSKLLPGQSSVRFNYKKLSLGVSTENLWWGPGVRNSLVMSNTAAGFAHFTFNTTAPVKTKIGSFEWQVVGGFLKGSNILPPDTARTYQGQKLYTPKPDGDRYLNGMVVTWSPKWTPGLHLGVSRVFYQYSHNVTSDLNGYLPIVSALFKSNAKKEDEFGRDQLISLFARMVLPESRAEFYFEYGRNDHAQNIRDFILEPEHARAYLIGIKKLFPTATGREVELFGEITHLPSPPTQSVRALEGWYTHYQVMHGYTHRGQMLGAGIGPGGSSQTIGLNWLKGENRFGGVIERTVHNNDFYYDAFASQQNYERHWVDLSFSLNKSWMKKRLIYSANLGLVRSFNYKWQYNTIADDDVNATNVHAAFSVSFL